MQTRKQMAFVVMTFLLVLSACAPIQSESVMGDKPTEAMMVETKEVMMDKPTEGLMDKPTEAIMQKPTEDAMMNAPAWFGVTLTNVNTGETFTINDFKGKVVLVETMAMWCSTCLRQQKEVMGLHDQLGTDIDLVSIALDIDPNEDGEALKDYAASNGFGWIYTISSADVSRELGKLYGSQFLNPPSAPILLIDRHGVVHLLPFGVKGAEDLLNAIQPLLDAGM